MGATADVLLVSDTVRDGVLIADAIHHALPGIRIEAVTGAEDALFYVFRARRFAQRDLGAPRLVLLDIGIQGIGGMQVLQRLKQDSTSRSMPIVVFSRDASAKTVARCYRLGANSFLLRSAESSRFLLDIQQSAKYWLALNVCTDGASLDACAASAQINGRAVERLSSSELTSFESASGG